MSAQIFDEVDYNAYLIDKYWDKFESNPIELTESPDEYDFDNYPRLSTKDALTILDIIYQQNSYALYKEPWYNFLFTRLKKDLKKGFVSMINIQPTLFQRTVRFFSPMLRLFSSIEMFKDVLDKTDMFYETCIAGCYNSKTNKMLIVINYIDKPQINVDMLKTILHEYCHFYARKKHALYVQFFEGMVSKFYKTLIEAISHSFNLNLDNITIQRLHESIMKWNFYKLESPRVKKHNFEKCVEELGDINEDFVKIYMNMLRSRALYSQDDAYKVSIEVMRQAYASISDQTIASHIAKIIYSYQEYYCADEIVAVMSFYKPNYKPYLQMLESLV